jgi:adenosine deaminase
VVLDFAADNVVYVELRTTPKERVSSGMTKESYVQAVLDGVALGVKQLEGSQG